MFEMKKNKKIAFYIESMVVGGAEKVLIDMVNNLDQNKFDITVIAIFKKSVYSDYQFVFEESFSPHITFKYLIDNTNRLVCKSFNFLYNKISKEIIYKVFIKEKYDIEVAFYEGLPTEFVSFSSQNSIKIAWLHTNQERLYQDMPAREFKDKTKIYQKFNEIVGVSQSVVASFTKFFESLPAVHLYNPLNEQIITERSELPLNKRMNVKPYFITVGRLIPIKGYDRLISALATLKKENYDFNLIIVGDGFKRLFLEDFAAKQGVSENIIFYGHADNPYPLIKNAELFICSSIQEGLSTVVTEALILGVPIVTTHCSGMNELVENDVTGMICENSEEGLYNSIKSILDHPEKFIYFRNNIEKSKSRFFLKTRMAAIESFFELLN